jgi:hypothetical protein
LISKSALRFPGKQPNSNVLVCLRYSLKPPEITAEEEEAKLNLEKPSSTRPDEILLLNTTGRTGPIR